MSLRWTSYVAPKPPKGGWKTQNGRIPTKIALSYRCPWQKRPGHLPLNIPAWDIPRLRVLKHKKLAGAYSAEDEPAPHKQSKHTQGRVCLKYSNKWCFVMFGKCRRAFWAHNRRSRGCSGCSCTQGENFFLA